METLVTLREGARSASINATLPRPIYRLRNCVVSVGARDILAAGVSQHIEPRAFDALIYLIEHRDRIVTKHELLCSVWGRVEVSDSVVARSIMKARMAIGDDGSVAPQIQTAHRVGYRFVGEVEVQLQSLHSAQTPVGGVVPQATALRAVEFDDAFETEAHDRAIRAIAQQDWSRALPLLNVLAQQYPHDNQLQLRLLRVQSALCDPETPHTGLRLLQAAHHCGDLRLAASVLHDLARHSLACGGYNECDDHLDAALAYAKHCGHAQTSANLLLRAAAALHRRDLQAARHHLDASRDLVDCGNNRALQANWRCLAGLLEFRAGRLDSAERLVDEALVIARPAELRACVAVGLWAHARIRANLGRLGCAAVLAREALSIAISLRDGPRIVEIGLTAALMFGELRDADAGRELLNLLDTHPGSRSVQCADLQTLARALVDARAPGGGGLAAACERLHHVLLRGDVWPAAALALHRAGCEADAQMLLASVRKCAEETGDADLRYGLAYVDGFIAFCADDRALARRHFAAAAEEGAPCSLWRLLACLDGAWLAIEDGDLAAATQLLLIAGHGAQEHPAGMRVRTRLSEAFGGTLAFNPSEVLPSLAWA